MPAGAVVVARPSPFGNPHAMPKPANREDHLAAVLAYREHLARNPRLVERIRRELAGRDLACWCALDAACHADVLLEIANR